MRKKKTRKKNPTICRSQIYFLYDNIKIPEMFSTFVHVFVFWKTCLYKKCFKNILKKPTLPQYEAFIFYKAY